MKASRGDDNDKPRVWWRWRSAAGLLLAIAAVSVTIVLLASGAKQSSEPTRVIIATGSSGGSYDTLGSRLINAVGENPDYRFVTRPGGGSVENLKAILDGRADFAFVARPQLDEARAVNPAVTDDVKIVAGMYPAVLHLVINAGGQLANVKSMEELRNVFDEHKVPQPKKPDPLRVYMGPPGSGTREIASCLLDAYRLNEWEHYQVSNRIRSFGHAAAAIAGRVKGQEIDLAFMDLSLDNESVTTAMDSRKCHLLHVGLHRAVPIGKPFTIPQYTYAGQTERVHTISVDQYLVCRADVEGAAIEAIHEALGNNRHALLEASPTGLDIQYKDLPSGFSLHQAVARQIEGTPLLIATGPFDEQYYQMGRRIQEALRREQIDSIVLPTDGSMENLRLLRERPNTLAIVQYEAAVAARTGEAKYVYRGEPLDGGDWQVPFVPDVRRLAGLYEERLYVFKNLHPKTGGQANQAEQPDGANPVNLSDCLTNLGEDASVNLGPPRSGTRLMAEAAISQLRSSRRSSGVSDEAHTLVKRPVYCSLKRMIKGFENNDIAMGFAVTGDGNKLVERLLHDTENVALVPLSEATIGGMRGDAIGRGRLLTPKPSVAEAETEPFPTLKTTAVLVTNSRIADNQAAKITEAIVNNIGLLKLGSADVRNLDADLAMLAAPLDSIPLHDEARGYYEELGLLKASPDWLDKLERSRTVIGLFQWILIFVVGGLASFVYVTWPTRRKAAEILNVVQENEDNPDKLVLELKNQRREVNRRVSRSWLCALLPGTFNLAQYRMLTELIDRHQKLAEDRTSTAMRGHDLHDDNLVASPAKPEELSEEEVKQLVAELESDDSSARGIAYRRLRGLRGREAASEAILKAFNDKNGWSHIYARYVLMHADPTAVPPLSRTLATHKSPAIRYAAVWALGALVSELGPKPVESAVPNIIRAMKDKSPNVRKEAEVVLREFEPKTPGIEDALTVRSESVILSAESS